ncbi:MAG: hypothetical protein MZV64_12325 [Ignavibacteriales bacterium]|nr:hypothetical protein [Ignavibacteriales bacterium]
MWYTDTDSPIGIVSYIETTNQNEASILTYQKYNDITHSARIVGDGSRFISKWGSNPIINHPPNEVPVIYGSIYKYYKINRTYRPIGSGDPAGRNWQTINNAMNGIPSNGKVFVLSGTTTSSGTVSIPSGVELKVNRRATLSVQSGSTLNFSNTAKFNVYGTLNATNSTFDFTAQNSSLQNGIRCYNSSTTNISGCTIRNGWYGISLDNYVASHVTNTSDPCNCRYGFYAYNSAHG